MNCRFVLIIFFFTSHLFCKLSLIFFQIKERLIQTMATVKNRRFPGKKGQKRRRSMGVRHLGSSRYFGGVEKIWLYKLKIHFKNFLNFRCFEKTWVPYSKSAVFSDVCFGFVFWIFKWQMVATAVHLKQVASEEKGIWQDYHASTPSKINKDAQMLRFGRSFSFWSGWCLSSSR